MEILGKILQYAHPTFGELTNNRARRKGCYRFRDLTHFARNCSAMPPRYKSTTHDRLVNNDHPTHIAYNTPVRPKPSSHEPKYYQAQYTHSSSHKPYIYQAQYPDSENTYNRTRSS
jgi:hypothetical protein